MKPAMTVGEILLEDYLVPMSISQTPSREPLASAHEASTKSFSVGAASRPKCRSNSENSSIKQSAQFWFNIQTTCDFRQLLKKEKQITAAVTKDYTELAA